MTYYNRFIRSILLFVIPVIYVLFMTTLSFAASASYERLEDQFLRGQYNKVIEGCQRGIDAGYSNREDLFYLKGLCELKIGRYKEARESFGPIATSFSRSKKAFDAYLGIGDSYMLEGKVNAAVGVYNGMLNDFKSDGNLSMVYSRLAGCYKALGDNNKVEEYQAMAKRSSPLGFDSQLKGSAYSSKSVSSVQNFAKSYTGYSTGRSSTLKGADIIYSVQVGSFKNPNNARRLSKMLVSRGYDSRVVTAVKNSGKFYRVRVGKVNTRGEAEVLEARLKRAGYNTRICGSNS